MTQQSSYPVELTGELLKAESLKDGQHDLQVLRVPDRKDYRCYRYLNARTAYMHVTGAE